MAVYPFILYLIWNNLNEVLILEMTIYVNLFSWIPVAVTFILD